MMQVIRKDGECTLIIVTDPVFEPGAFGTLVIEQISDQDHTIILDLTKIVMIHSPGLAELTRIYVHLQKRDVELILIGLNDFNRRLMATTKLDAVITIRD